MFIVKTIQKNKWIHFKAISIEDAETLIHTPEILAQLGDVLSKHDQTYSNTESRFEELSI